jgi:solute carrier family 5 (sodium-coupled monocarboxylate transporter), member 8/12
MVQRYLSLKDVKTARLAIILYVIGVSLMIFLCSFNGLLLFATYHDCDPLTTKLAKAKDQMMPLLVMEILKDVPGLPGLFIAGVFSAALSSLSTGMFLYGIKNIREINFLSLYDTGLNSMSAVVLEDFVKPFMKSDLSESMSTYIMRGTVLVLGVVSVALVYVVQHLGQVLQLSLSIPAACYGPMLGIYTIGFFIPWIGKKATFVGALTGCVVMLTLIIKAQLEIANGNMYYNTKPLTVEGCTYNFTIEDNDSDLNATQTVLFDERPEKHIYEISYLYYTLVGSVIVVISAFIYSFIFGFQDPKEVDAKLLAPIIRKYIHTEFEKVHYTESHGKDTVVHNFEIKENNCRNNKL